MGRGTRVCVRCGRQYESYNKARLYCRHACYSEGRKTRRPRPCQACRTMFVPHVPSRKFCSVACLRVARPRVYGYVPHPRPSKRVAKDCQHCGEEFVSLPSQGRKFCSYQCFLGSGGPLRAGDAAARARMKYGTKKDANHRAIFDLIRVHTEVRDLSSLGCGCPDGIAWVSGGWHLFDVKNPKTGYGRRGLNKRQKEWASGWRGGPVYLVYTEEDALALVRGEFDKLKCFPDREEKRAAS